VYGEFIGKRDDPQEAAFATRQLCPKTDNDSPLAAQPELAIERLEYTFLSLGMGVCAGSDFRNKE